MSSRLARSATGAESRPKQKRRRFQLDPRGQSLVEFAISAPVIFLMILFGVDFGRVFLGWVTLTNTTRVAANFAAIHPTAWTSPGNVAVQTEFARLINAEAAGSNCTLPATLPDPAFPNGTVIGSPAIVSITCQFALITPFLGNLMGDPIAVSASSSFPIRSGLIPGTPGFGSLPTVGPVVPTPTPFATPSQIPTPSPAATPVQLCLVPDLRDIQSNKAVGDWWVPAGFNANSLAFSPLVPPHYRIRVQTLAAGTSVACSSSMTVTP